jgi:hypothetical protein
MVLVAVGSSGTLTGYIHFEKQRMDEPHCNIGDVSHRTTGRKSAEKPKAGQWSMQLHIGPMLTDLRMLTSQRLPELYSIACDKGLD